jgi:ferredoxin-NADP reductase
MQLKLVSTRPETASVTSFLFEKPKDFQFSAGQFTNITIPVDNCDERCNSRNYSISSSPLEEFLMITTRHGVSRFKQTLQAALPGFEVDLKGPFGKLILTEDPHKEAVLIAGGIGITPLHSIIKYATEKQLPKKITLLYSNKTADDIPFYTELEELRAKNPQLTIHYTVTQNTDTSWHGKTGRITKEVIQELIPHYQDVEYYVTGPAPLVLDMKKQLKEINVADLSIKSELFTGY